jgi:hypothetical protein
LVLYSSWSLAYAHETGVRITLAWDWVERRKIKIAAAAAGYCSGNFLQTSPLGT